jgi:hypothetical protein
MTDNIVQVVHTRYTDEGCNIEVFLNGRRVEATVENVDPGRGYGKREWARRVKKAEQEAIDFPTDFTAAVAEALAINADSKYLDEDEDEDEEDEDDCPACYTAFENTNYACWLSDLHGKSQHEGRFMLLAGHRQSADAPSAYGPFESYDAARDFARERVVDGEWDPTGVTLTFSRVQS